MKDIYLMKKSTGEIEPATKVIRDFYKTHDALDAWTDEWIETDLEVEDIKIDLPDFTRVINH